MSAHQSAGFGQIFRGDGRYRLGEYPLAWYARLQSVLARDFGFGLDDLRAFMLNGLDGAWIDDSTRRAWRAGFLQDFDALRRELESPSAPA